MAKDPEMRNITRMALGRTLGWYVRLERKGVKPIRKFFSDYGHLGTEKHSRYDTREDESLIQPNSAKALRKAKRYRDRMIEVMEKRLKKAKVKDRK